MSEFIFSIIVSLIVTVISYGAYPYIFSKNRTKPITKRKFMWSCIGYTFLVLFLWNVYYAANGNDPSSGGAAILWGTIFYSNAKGRLRGKGLLIESSSKGKAEQKTIEPEQQKVAQENVEMVNAVEGAKLSMKGEYDLLKETRRLVQQAQKEGWSDEKLRQERRNAVDRVYNALLEEQQNQQIGQPKEELEIQRWYTCPKCGQMVKDGKECDCEAVKLALEEEKKKKEEQRQQKRQTLKKALPFYSVCFVILVVVCVMGVYSYNLKIELEELSDCNNIISVRYENQKKEIKELEQEKEKFEQEKDTYQDVLFNIIDRVAYATEDGNYHHALCSTLTSTSKGIWFERDFCEEVGYKPCKECADFWP